VPTKALTPAAACRSVNAVDVHWADPASLWWISPAVAAASPQGLLQGIEHGRGLH
jgi:hypothetical protein